MWNPHRSGDRDSGRASNTSSSNNVNSSSNIHDPVRLAAVSALAAFSQSSSNSNNSNNNSNYPNSVALPPMAFARTSSASSTHSSGNIYDAFYPPQSLYTHSYEPAGIPATHRLVGDVGGSGSAGTNRNYPHEHAAAAAAAAYWNHYRPDTSNAMYHSQRYSSGAPVIPQHGFRHSPPPKDDIDEDSKVASEDQVETRKSAAQVGATSKKSGSSSTKRKEKPVKSTAVAANKKTASKPRGKPEAIAVALAASKIQAKKEELEKEAEAAESESITQVEVEAEVIKTSSTATKADGQSKKVDKSKQKASPKKRSNPSQKSSSKARLTDVDLSLREKAKPISDVEYQNLEELMVQFCRVPLLSEFSRPVALLHPELASAYSKVVTHPVDLGLVCRGIRRRQYKSTRDVRIDMWRVFANCVKFHTHPNNKEAVPSFVSIALHLREFFNNLWYEYMLPSEMPENLDKQSKRPYLKREAERKKRLENSGVLMMSPKYRQRCIDAVSNLIDDGGRVDKLDAERLWGLSHGYDPITEVVVQRLREIVQKLETQSEHTVEEFLRGLRNACPVEEFVNKESLHTRLMARIERFIGKFAVPLHEANSRGVTQSSIWGNIATTIWARESSKKPYWPALCLGILPPEDQRENWHSAVTERNESRLPDRLREQLMAAKKRCEQAQKRQSMSYFLVEFMGTHEFIWVRELDIVENFDPKQDPNKDPEKNKRKRNVRGGVNSVLSSKTYTMALEECGWATEEFESVLLEALEYDDAEKEDDDDNDEMNYSFSLLAQSDDEADEEDKHVFEYNESVMSLSDVDEANWLLTHEGYLDISADGRKNAKKRTQEMKKKAAAEKAKKEAAIAQQKIKDKKVAKPVKVIKAATTAKKTKSDDLKKKKETKDRDRIEKQESREIERRRRRRQKERERALKSNPRKVKRRRSSVDEEEDERGLIRDKRARATAIVKGYLSRMADNEDYTGLAYSGVMTIPAAMINSTDLLGMALAFRAAAGELPMPDGEGQDNKLKPWTAINTVSPLAAEKREERLEEQVELIKKQIEKVKANTKRRRELLAQTLPLVEKTRAQILADEQTARQNNFKKKKKSIAKSDVDDASVRKSVGSSSVKSRQESDASDIEETDNTKFVLTNHDTNSVADDEVN